MKYALKYPKKKGHLDIYPEVYYAEETLVHIIGDPAGLRYLGQLLKMVARVDQNKNDYPVGSREHAHLDDTELGSYSCPVVIYRADAKGTGEFPEYMRGRSDSYGKGTASKKRKGDDFPEKRGAINIYPEIVHPRVIAVCIIGDPEGLMYFAEVLDYVAGIDQEENEAGDRSREHIHLYPERQLDDYSCNVEICRADEKGTGLLPVFMR